MKSLFSILIISAAFLVVPAVAGAQVFSGRLIKGPDSTAVYYVGEDGKRHAFPNEKIYKSWYSDFSGVEVVPAGELASYPLGKNVLYRPGSRLIKIPSVPEVYAVEPWGVLRNIPSEAAAAELYGEDWAKKIDDIDVSFFFDYTIGGLIDMIDEKPVYPKGTLVHHDGLTYMADKRSDGIFLLRPVTVDGYTANRFQRLENRYFQDGILPQYYEEGIPVIYAEKAYSCVSCDPSLYKRVPVLQTAKKQGNGVSFEAPADWAVLFEEQKPDDLVPRLTLVVEQTADQIDGFADNFMIFAWDAEDFHDDLFALTTTIGEINEKVLYHGESLLLHGSIELTAVNHSILYRNHVFERGEMFYQVQFTSTEQFSERYIDVLDVFIKSLKLPLT